VGKTCLTSLKFKFNPLIQKSMISSQSLINIFINEPDVYENIEFLKYPEIGKIIQKDDIRNYNKVHAILVGLKDVIDDEFLMLFKRVEYIVSSTTGTDHIRTSRNIKIINLDPLEIQDVSATAEFTLALLLSLVRKIPFIDPNKVADRQIYRGTQLRGKRLGIFGMGRLGSKMARFAEALEMEWVGYDRRNSISDKKAILKTSDVITIHLPLREETLNFIGTQEFKWMEKKPFLINTSRPQLVNKKALIAALDFSLISGLAMDFINYDAGDKWDPELKKYLGKRLLLTPHIAGNTHESVACTAQIVVDKLVSEVAYEFRAR